MSAAEQFDEPVYKSFSEAMRRAFSDPQASFGSTFNDIGVMSVYSGLSANDKIAQDGRVKDWIRTYYRSSFDFFLLSAIYSPIEKAIHMAEAVNHHNDFAAKRHGKWFGVECILYVRLKKDDDPKKLGYRSLQDWAGEIGVSTSTLSRDRSKTIAQILDIQERLEHPIEQYLREVGLL